MNAPANVLIASRSLRALGAIAEATGRRRLLPSPPTRKARARALREMCQAALVTHGVKVDCGGIVPDEVVIVVANHASWLDPIVIGSLLPVAPIAKHEVRRWPILGPLCASLGCMFVERGSAHSGARVLRAARAALADGVNVLGFPEGTTRAFGQEPGPFHRGLFGLARRLCIPILPMALRYDEPAAHWVGDDAFIPHWLSVVGRRETAVRVRIGTPLHPLPCAPLGRLIDETRRALERLRRDEVSLSRWIG